MSDVSLNSGIRANLLQLQNSSDLFTRTTERLASGKKVNSAVDSPTNFFASVNLTGRAEDLSARLEGMGQAVQTIKAADNGISTIRSFISAAKGVVNNAIGSSSASERNSLGKQFNELLVQIRNAAKDSAYQGVNLLQGNVTNTIQFNEIFGDSSLDIFGFDVAGPGADGLALVDASGNLPSAAETAVFQQASISTVASQLAQASASAQASVASATGTAFDGTAATANIISVSLGGTGYLATGAAAASETIGTNSAPAVPSQSSSPSVASRASAAAGTITGAVALYIGNQTGTNNIGIQGAGTQLGSIDWGASNYQQTLGAIVQQLESFDSELKIQAGALSQNLAAVTIREEFSNNLINTLNEGADKLVLADLNEEGANLLALQTSTQLATQSLALASQQAQGVLQLLG
jgi:flagellin-like hook-associated protein FlgL